ncbi:hypothetical protein [Anaeromyxobacter paludicola]|uniref:DUF2069 domain-containing protein n=1 Tax=Anaeromyxobacter paludicola TaxID=2918171 RepID=A0ABM7X7R1_9BACT|nr:hypothetical protein [Anaeromyxobacter paludicola]BDG07873.1 hypothetical protein AMPC_09860 [Anaeromyxobacter paludicola]
MISVVSLAVSLWLFASAWLLPHVPANAANAVIVALVTAASAALSFRWPRAHYAILYAGIWLYLCPMMLPHDGLLVHLHDAAVAFTLIFLSLLSWSWSRAPRLLDDLRQLRA